MAGCGPWSQPVLVMPVSGLCTLIVCPPALWNWDFCGHCSFLWPHVPIMQHSGFFFCVWLIMQEWRGFRQFWAEVVFNALVVSFQPCRLRPRGAICGLGCFSAFLWPPWWDSCWLYWYATEAKRPNLGMFLLNVTHSYTIYCILPKMQ